MSSHLSRRTCLLGLLAAAACRERARPTRESAAPARPPGPAQEPEPSPPPRADAEPLPVFFAGGYSRDEQGTIAPVLAIHDATLAECHAAYSS